MSTHITTAFAIPTFTTVSSLAYIAKTYPKNLKQYGAWKGFVHTLRHTQHAARLGMVFGSVLYLMPTRYFKLACGCAGAAVFLYDNGHNRTAIAHWLAIRRIQPLQTTLTLMASITAVVHYTVFRYTTFAPFYQKWIASIFRVNKHIVNTIFKPGFHNAPGNTTACHHMHPDTHCAIYHLKETGGAFLQQLKFFLIFYGTAACIRPNKNVIKNATRSALFVTALVGLIKLFLCIQHKPLNTITTPDTLAMGALASTSALIETQQRRRALATYVMANALVPAWGQPLFWKHFLQAALCGWGTAGLYIHIRYILKNATPLLRRN